jgi:hypothetical protein
MPEPRAVPVTANFVLAIASDFILKAVLPKPCAGRVPIGGQDNAATASVRPG